MTFSAPGSGDADHYAVEGGIWVPSAEGTSKWFSGDVYTVKLTAEQTGGSLGFIDATVPPGSGPIPHLHMAQDETFYLLSGELEFLQGERVFTAYAGDLVFCPRRLRHRFHNYGPHAARMLFFYTPGGTEQTFLEAGEDPAPDTPSLPWGPDRIDERFIAVLEKYGTIGLPDDDPAGGQT